MSDLISRQDAIDALWKALYEYEDKTEKQFIDSEELDVADWIQHRNFVQNMSDIDRQTILGLPSAEPERKKGKWLTVDAGYYDYVKCSQCGETLVWGKNFCPNCGADMREGEEE